MGIALQSQRSRVAGQLSWLLLHAIRLGIGLLLVWSGLSKVGRSYDFLSDVYRYEMVGPRLGLWVAVVLPWLEVIVGVCLLGAVLVAGALLAAAALAGTFALANAYAIHRGLTIDCGCFGASSEKVGYATLIRAGIILMIAGAGYVICILKQQSELASEVNPSEPHLTTSTGSRGERMRG